MNSILSHTDFVPLVLKVMREQWLGDLAEEALLKPEFPIKVQTSIVRVPHSATIDWVVSFAIRGEDTFFIRYQIAERELYMAKSETELVKRILDNLLQSIPREVGPRLWEKDPRIGREVYVGDPDRFQEFPKVELFDPPGGIKPPGLLEMPMAGFHRMWCLCRACGKGHRMGQPVSWGGTNLLWLCGECAVGILSQEQLRRGFHGRFEKGVCQ